MGEGKKIVGGDPPETKWSAGLYDILLINQLCRLREFQVSPRQRWPADNVMITTSP
jgi:hypothetical protein